MCWKTLKQWHSTLRLRGHLSLGKLSSSILGHYALNVVPDAVAGRGNPCVTMCLAGHKSARLAARWSLGDGLQSQSVLTELEGCADFHIQLRAQLWTAGKQLQLWPLMWPVMPGILLVRVTTVTMKSLLSAGVWSSRRCHCGLTGSFMFWIRALGRTVRGKDPAATQGGPLCGCVGAWEGSRWPE